MPTKEALESREVAEASRETEWQGGSFLKELFLGNYRLDCITPFPVGRSERPAFRAFYDRLEHFLERSVDPVAIDRTGEYPPAVVDGLRALGAFGMKIPTEYGGLGLTHPEYVEVMALLGSRDANLTALLSAHQAIGVPNPVKLFGTEAQKREYLPRCAKGAISAFALTEGAVGSDPARLTSVAEPTADGRHYVLNGEKLWCTNGTLAELLVVMARDPTTNRIDAFIVETSWPGVEIVHRSRFMGLRALANAVVRFENVKVPVENRIGPAGQGLRIALATLNTGRMTLPAATAGGAKLCVEMSRKWAQARVQWGVPIGRHEAIAHKIAKMAGTTFAMESVAMLVADLADRPGYDIRLEAAAAKEWNTVRYWRLLDDTLQIRGGRGFETEDSLKERGEPPLPVERMMRDARINLIFEGSSEIMHLFMAREAVDTHLKVAGALVDPKAGLGDRVRALPGILAFYAWWYPTRWVGYGWWPKYREYGPLARHLRFAERASRRLARSIFHGMVVHRAQLERRQAFLFRTVDIAMELFALTASVARAQRMRELGELEARSAVDLADGHARLARRKIRRLFRALWRNDDRRMYRTGREVLDGRHRWLEDGTMGIPYEPEDLRPRSVAERMAMGKEARRQVVGEGAPPRV
jgi:alkylation response protein AidB-like acyl-CoA dehydrogenase